MNTPTLKYKPTQAVAQHLLNLIKQVDDRIAVLMTRLSGYLDPAPVVKMEERSYWQTLGLSNIRDPKSVLDAAKKLPNNPNGIQKMVLSESSKGSWAMTNVSSNNPQHELDPNQLLREFDPKAPQPAETPRLDGLCDKTGKW